MVAVCVFLWGQLLKLTLAYKKAQNLIHNNLFYEIGRGVCDVFLKL